MHPTIDLGPMMASAANCSPFSNTRFEETAKSILPQLLAEAKKIHMPTYMDHEDLAQEALLHLYSRRGQFDSRRTHFRAWSSKLARNRYLNLAVAAYRHRRHPAGYVPWTEGDGEPYELETVAQNEGYATIAYDQLLAKVEAQLRPTSRRVLRALVEQPQELLDLIRAEYRENLRQRETGSRRNQPLTLRMSNTALAQHLQLKYSTVARAMREIAHVAKQECIQ